MVSPIMSAKNPKDKDELVLLERQHKNLVEKKSQLEEEVDLLKCESNSRSLWLKNMLEMDRGAIARIKDMQKNAEQDLMLMTGKLKLAELKVISCCPTRYQRDPRATIKAVDRRAVTLPNEYRQHARKIDREYGGVQEGVVGLVEAKLIAFPPLRRWVFGAWGKASEDVHILVKDLATSRVKHQQELDGRWRWDQTSQEAEVAIYTGQIRRLLSVQGVRSQVRCLLDRVRGLGAGAAPAARR